MTEVAPQDVLAQLRTRGFEEGFESPLKELKGRLTSIGGTMVDRMTPPRLEVIYNFDEVEVIYSTVPYISPVAQITMLHSNRGKSPMGYLGTSIDAIINAGLPEDAPADQVKGQDYLIGKVLHMKFTPGHMIWNKQAGEERPTDCWEVLAVDGVTAPGAPLPPAPVPVPDVPVAALAPTLSATVSSVQQALRLLNGKTEQQWNQDVFIDPVVRADADLVNKILTRVFLPPLIEVGTVVVDVTTGIHTVTAGI